MRLIPKEAFLTKGKGIHREQLASFEEALRDADIEQQNLVYVSSIFAPKCKLITKEKGLEKLLTGEITFCVMSMNQSNEPHRLLSASIGLAVPKDRGMYGYISEHHAYGQNEKESGDYAEDLAASMLATTMGIKFNADEAYDKRKEVYKMSRQIVRSQSITQSTGGNKNGLWTTVLSAAVFILELEDPFEEFLKERYQHEYKAWFDTKYKKPKSPSSQV